MKITEFCGNDYIDIDIDVDIHLSLKFFQAASGKVLYQGEESWQSPLGNIDTV